MKVDWPYNSDSAPAFFRVSVKADQISGGNTQAELDVRLYHRGDLLDIVRVTISVTTARPAICRYRGRRRTSNGQTTKTTSLASTLRPLCAG